MLFSISRINSQRTPLTWFVVWLVLSLFSSTSAIANTLQKVLKFDHFSVDDGLTQSSVIDMTQDKYGYLWIATHDGLNRFDGQNFTHFNAESNHHVGLPSNFIRSLLYDSSQRLWVGTENGIALYRPSKNNFADFDLTGNNIGHRIWDIFEVSDNQIWISTEQGLARLNEASGKFEPVNFYTESGEPLLLSEIKAAYQQGQKLWLGSYEHGLYLVDLAQGIGRRVPLLSATGEPVTSIHKIVRHQQQLWLASNHGIQIINDQGKQVTAPQITFPPVIQSTEIRSINFSAAGKIWVGTTNGLYTGDATTPLHQVQDQTTTYSSVGSSFIMTLYRDRAHNLWIGSQGGLTRHRSITRQFPHYQLASASQSNQNSVSTLTEDLRGNIWIASDSGDLLEWQPNTKRAITRLSGLPPIRRLRYDGQRQVIWLASAQGLGRYDIKQQHLSWLTPPNDLTSLMDVVIANPHTLYVASQNHGLLSYRPETDVWQAFALPVEIKPGAAHLNTLLKLEDKLWIGSAEGAFYFDLNELRFNFDNPLSPQHNGTQAPGIWSLQGDRDGLWLGSFDKGLYFIGNQGETEHFDRDSNLSNNYIYAIEKEAPGVVWVSTNLGLNRIDRNKKTIHQYTEKDGLQGNEFNHHASLASRSGYLYFGGLNGFNAFLPRHIHDEEFHGKVVLEELSVYNKPIIPGKNEPRLQSDISTQAPVHLFYHDSPFSIKFTVPNAPRPERIQYQYRLKGFDQQWLNINSRVRQATYTNIPVGNYQFEVRAHDINGQWQTDVTRLPIEILPPPWRTMAAYSIYALIAASLICLLVLYLRQLARQRHRIASSEERLKLSLWGSGDELWDWNIKTGKIYRSNIWNRLNFPQDGTRSGADSKESNIHPNDLPRVQEALQAHFNGHSEYYQATYRVRDKDGQWLWILDRGKIVAHGDDGAPLRMTGTIKDINQLKLAEEQLKLFAQSFENISDGVFILDKDLHIIEINQSYTRISGENRDIAIGRSLTFNQYPPNFTAQLHKALTQNGRWFGELEAVRPDGSRYMMELAIDAIRNDNHEISHYVGVFSDISSRKQTEDELRKLANSDTLTGLANRSLFQANHSNLVSRNISHALLVCDLDNFKKINDSMSHKVGDQLLCLVANRLLMCGREEDALYRLGGDEFAVLIEGDADISTVTKVAKRMQKAMQEPFELQGRELVVTASIGIVMFPIDGNDSQELLRNADTVMYHAKSMGQNRYAFFSESMNRSAVHQLQLESLVRQAIREDLFVVEYQPKFNLADRTPSGMEALVRLDHPTHGRIAPTDFIPLAEETGLIVEIGDIVLKKACFATEAWRRRGLLDARVAVNVSAKQFTDGDLPARVEQILDLTQLPPQSLELEITEGAVMAAPETAIAAMSTLRDMGVHIALDDFGTGYSSLAYLKRFPIDTLKIDRTFVQDIATTSIDRKMVASIIAIAHNLDLAVVAEGVEEEAQLELLKSMKCQYMQGFLLSKPLSESQFNDFLLTFKRGE